MEDKTTNEELYCVVSGKPGSMSISAALPMSEAEKTKNVFIANGLSDARIVTAKEGRDFKRLAFARPANNG